MQRLCSALLLVLSLGACGTEEPPTLIGDNKSSPAPRTGPVNALGALVRGSSAIYVVRVEFIEASRLVDDDNTCRHYVLARVEEVLKGGQAPAPQIAFAYPAVQQSPQAVSPHPFTTGGRLIVFLNGAGGAYRFHNRKERVPVTSLADAWIGAAAYNDTLRTKVRELLLY